MGKILHHGNFRPEGMESEGTAFFPSDSGCPENGNTRCLLSENNIA